METLNRRTSQPLLVKLITPVLDEAEEMHNAAACASPSLIAVQTSANVVATASANPIVTNLLQIVARLSLAQIRIDLLCVTLIAAVETALAKQSAAALAKRLEELAKAADVA